MLCIGCNRNDVFKQSRFGYSPFQQLLSAHRAANANMDFFNTQSFAQRLIGTHHILNGEPREISVPVIAVERTDTSIMTAGHVHTNNEILCRVEELAFTYQATPPICCIGVSSECMKNPDRIALLCIECTPSLVSKVITGYHLATFQSKICCMLIDGHISSVQKLVQILFQKLVQNQL